MQHDIGAAKRQAASKRSRDLVTKTPIEGLDVPALARRTWDQLKADIARGCPDGAAAGGPDNPSHDETNGLTTASIRLSCAHIESNRTRTMAYPIDNLPQSIPAVSCATNSRPRA